jgi:hypothetical protein
MLTPPSVKKIAADAKLPIPVVPPLQISDRKSMSAGSITKHLHSLMFGKERVGRINFDETRGERTNLQKVALPR